MANRRAKRGDGPDFLRMLGWTVLLSLICSAALIVGEELLHDEDRPLVETPGGSRLSTESEDPDRHPPATGSPESEDAVYSFYDRLAGGGAAQTEDEGSGSEEEDSEERPARFTVQIGAYPTVDEAESKMRKLQKRGLDPYLATSTLEGQGEYHRVRIGKYPTEEEAESAAERLDSRDGLETFVTTL